MVNRKIRIIVACGASIAQSTMLQMQISEAFSKKKIPLEILKCTFAELAGKVSSFKPDLVYTAGKVPFELPAGLPAFDGLNIITGFGKQEMFDQMFKIVEKIEE